MRGLSIAIVDGFSGGGAYTDAITSQRTEGSPLLMLRAIDEAQKELNVDREIPRIIDAEFHFIDKEKNISIIYVTSLMLLVIFPRCIKTQYTCTKIYMKMSRLQ